jgi:hypothetical protein
MKPSFTDEKGTKYFFNNGELQGTIHPNGYEYWYKNDQLHREDGPAIIEPFYQAWYINGQITREFGLHRRYVRKSQRISLNSFKFTIKDGF